MVMDGKGHHGSDVGRGRFQNHPIPDSISTAFSSEADAGSGEESALKQNGKASVLILPETEPR
jgi:hypothetical protein